jgi:hypothetical protein
MLKHQPHRALLQLRIDLLRHNAIPQESQGGGTKATPVQTSMKAQGLAGIPLYPELRNCPAPSAPRILEIFDDLARHQLINADNDVVQTFQPQLTDPQQQVLDLLHIPASIYNQNDAT